MIKIRNKNKRKWTFRGVTIQYKDGTRVTADDFEFVDLRTGFPKVLDKCYDAVREEVHDILYNTYRGDDIYRVDLNNVQYLDGNPGPGCD